MPTSRASSCAIAVLVLLVAPLARGAGKEARARAAKKACLSGDYAKGVRILADLFIDTGDPNHLFNQGRCFEQNNRCEEAVGRFREYLRKANGLNQAERADVEKHIADCQALLGKGERAAPDRRQDEAHLRDFGSEPSLKVGAAPLAPPSPVVNPPPAAPTLPPAAPTLPPAAPTLPPAETPTEEAGTVSDAPQASNTGRGLRIAGISCGVAGLAAIGTGIYYYTRARSLSDTVSHSHPPNPADEQAGKDAQTMQWVFYGVGAAALATGTLLYLLGWPSAVHPVAGVTPMIGPGMAGVSAQGAF